MITTPYYSEFRQAEAIQFFYGISLCFANIDTPTFHIFHEVETYTNAVNAVLNAYKPADEHRYGEELSNLDEIRDHRVKVLYNISSTFSKHYETDLIAAGKLIVDCITNYGDLIYKMNYSEETSVLSSLYEDLTTNTSLVNAVATCGLTKVVEDVNASNIAFQDLYFERIKQRSAADEVSVSELFTDAYRDFKNLLTKIEACVTVFADLDYSFLIRQLNETIETFNQTVVNRKAKKTS